MGAGDRRPGLGLSDRVRTALSVCTAGILVLGCLGASLAVSLHARSQDAGRQVWSFRARLQKGTPGRCTLLQERVEAVCRHTEACADWGPPRCFGGGQRCLPSCNRFAPALACVCSATALVDAPGVPGISRRAPAKVDVGLTTDLATNRTAWCLGALREWPWPAIVISTPAVGPHLGCCSRMRDGAPVEAERFLVGAQPLCLVDLIPGVPLDCVVLPGGQVMLGSREMALALAAEAVEHHTEAAWAAFRLRAGRFALAVVLGLLLCACALLRCAKRRAAPEQPEGSECALESGSEGDCGSERQPLICAGRTRADSEGLP